ncbi:MAG: hypothetical protein A2508_03910 [Candidatus Lambdaproteobacteria bacterium RIFOXYD12_FULL_49_8]|uniref:TfoX N-terminal domain-containing protein n=1 Tax=Candidatus Lambdaproteobacteria bacterium RIFOXYD2_FULL_50_16 TaxID=1817772 RepID=A0A1F6GDQ8_9PROT|nr:MAG: hypothetical protein A2527_04450 [Candidatus Lambdaproteobacteria bacterium RIFOXYD2_FULL_50_16]OGG98301.1 MAG: hypothetical protein A2508_03910 [Candidatus Lambdaproteobacteria bacterium RIFOXYD12_FULL_49_8]
MAYSQDFLEFCLDQLDGLEGLVYKRMFGGVGLYAEGWFFGLIAEDRLYLKTDETNRPDFEKLGMGPFVPFADKAYSMGYHEVAAEILEDSETLFKWSKIALEVAKRAGGKKKSKPIKTGA